MLKYLPSNSVFELKIRFRWLKTISLMLKYLTRYLSWKYVKIARKVLPGFNTTYTSRSAHSFRACSHFYRLAEFLKQFKAREQSSSRTTKTTLNARTIVWVDGILVHLETHPNRQLPQRLVNFGRFFASAHHAKIDHFRRSGCEVQVKWYTGKC